MNDTPTTPDEDAERNFAALRATADATQRENAFLRAGIDVDSAQGKLLMKGYEGQLDPALIKAYRDEVFPAAPAQPEATTPPPAAEQPPADPFATELQGQQAIRDAFITGQPGTLEPPPPKNTYDDVFEHYLGDEKNLPTERKQLAAIDRVIVAGAAGNKDVLLDERWEQAKAEAGHAPKKIGET